MNLGEYVELKAKLLKIKKKPQFNPESGKTNTCWQFYLSRQNEVNKFASEIGFNNTWLKERYQNGSKLENASKKSAGDF